MYLAICSVSWSIISLSTAWGQAGGGSAAFEGVIHARTQTEDELQFIEFYVKTDKIRIDATLHPAGASYYLVDYAAKKQYVVMPFRDRYVPLSIPDVRDRSTKGTSSAGLTKSDTTEEVAGILCDVFNLKFQETDYTIWATTKLGVRGTFAFNLGSFLLGVPPWQQEMLGLGYFPLKITLVDEFGGQRVVFEATGFQRRSVGESLFRIPSDFEATTMEKLMQESAPAKKRNR
jgi:hypothetical protein